MTETTAAGVSLRSATADDTAQLRRLNEIAFGYTYDDDALGPWVEAYDGEFSQVAEIEGQVVGAGATFEMSLTLPGGVDVRCPGVTAVAVLSTHRRRGLLRSMMTRQLGEMRRQGVIVTALTASEATIYEKFGFGVASTYGAIEIDTTRAAMRVPELGGSIRFLSPEAARSLLPGLHDARRRFVPGMTSRPTPMWDFFFLDHESARDGRSGLFYAVHTSEHNDPDGYVAYRIKELEGHAGPRNEVHVEQLVGVRPAVEMELWRFVCSIDLATSAHATVSPADPIRMAFEDARAVATTAIRDHLWVRPLDLAAVYAARRYERDGEIVIGSVDWEFPANTGQFRLTVRDGVAEVVRTDDPPTASADIASWGALLLGGVSASDLRLVGRLTGDAESVDSLVRTAQLPWCDVDF